MNEDSYNGYACPNCGGALFGARNVGTVRTKCQKCGRVIEYASGRKPALQDLGKEAVADESLATGRCPVCGRRLCDFKDTEYLRLKCSKCRHVIVLGGAAARDLGRAV